MKKVVNLMCFKEAAIIIPSKSGVFFTNQVNGVSCYHPEIEGILIPIHNDYDFLWLMDFKEKYTDTLEYHLTNLIKWNRDDITSDTADKLDNLFQHFKETKGISVDRDKIGKSMESWVWVISKENPDAPYTGFGEFNGILTWPNSD